MDWDTPQSIMYWTELTYLAWVALVFTLHLGVPVAKSVAFCSVVNNPALAPSTAGAPIRLNLGTWGWCDMLRGNCSESAVGYNFTGFLRAELDYDDVWEGFSSVTRVHGLLPVVLILGLVTIGLGVWATHTHQPVRGHLATFGCALLTAFTTMVYSCVVWKWAADLNGALKAHTTAQADMGHATWILIPVFFWPWAAAGAFLLRARAWADAPHARHYPAARRAARTQRAEATGAGAAYPMPPVDAYHPYRGESVGSPVYGGGQLHSPQGPGLLSPFHGGGGHGGLQYEGRHGSPWNY